MPTYKRIDGDYVITTINSNDYMVVNTHTMEINGNLNVRGNLTYIEVTELKVDDPFIMVAANNSGNLQTAPFQSQGLVAQTSANTFAGLRFNNAAEEWEISSDVDSSGDPITPYQAIGTSAAGSPGGNVNDIQFKNGGNTFGGNGAFQFDVANTQVSLQGHLVLGNIGVAPSATANAVALYNLQPGAGDSGVYVKTSTQDDELVSRAAAIVYAIIF
jgi:hypothetical protein